MDRSRQDQRTDAQLIAAANSGDATAFEALYDRYRDWVARLAMRITRDRELSMDVMQETFVYLLGKFPGFELSAQLKTFLYPVVRHTALAHARKRRPTVPLDCDDSARAGESKDRESDDLGHLHAAVESLKPGHREVLILRFVDDLSLQEIAVAMQIPLGTVKSRLHNALEHLRADERLRKFFAND